MTLPLEDMTFATGLNVLVGENGSGKTYLLQTLWHRHRAAASRVIFFPPHGAMGSPTGGAWPLDERGGAQRDLEAALMVPPLAILDLPRRALLEPLTAALGGRLVQSGSGFSLETTDGLLPLSMLGDGHRKLAALVRLVSNGTLTPGVVLLWDEPQAGLGPMLAHTLAMAIVGLVELGVQIFLSTHDYLLASELSLAVNTPNSGVARVTDAAFFGLIRVGQKPATVERAERFEALQANPILDAFSALHEREARAWASEPSRRAPVDERR